MEPFRILTLGTILLTLIISACTSIAPETKHSQPTSTLSPSSPVTMEEPTSEENANSVPREFTDKAKSDLASYLNIETDQIKLISASAIEWPDSSLGCPQSGMAYAQVITPGYLILLEASGEKYEYHTNVRNIFILCHPILEEKAPDKGEGNNVIDGWPNQTKDNNVVIMTPAQ